MPNQNLKKILCRVGNREYENFKHSTLYRIFSNADSAGNSATDDNHSSSYIVVFLLSGPSSIYEGFLVRNFVSMIQMRSMN